MSRRCVMLISRVEKELREGWDLTWYTAQLRREWTQEEARSTERVHGAWFAGFGEPYAYVGRESVMRWPDSVGQELGQHSATRDSGPGTPIS